MAIEVHKIANVSGNASAGFLAAVREYLVPDYFAEVHEDGNYSYSFKDADGNTIMRIYWDGTGAPAMQVYHFDGTNGSVSLGTSSNNQYLTHVYICGNGVFLIFGRYEDVAPDISNDTVVLVTKDTDGATGCAAWNSISTNPYISSSVYADTGTFQAYQVGWKASNQTQFVNIPTNPAAGATNYFPDAYYMPVGQLHTMGYGKFIANDRTYMTNGYIAILDEGEAGA